MILNTLCPPALLYLVFSLTQIAIDSMKGKYNTALIKSWVAFVFTILLNYLCESGLGIVSWIIVFVPFILMTLIVSILLLMFGLDPTTGKLKIKNKNDKPTHDHGTHRNKHNLPSDDEPIIPRHHAHKHKHPHKIGKKHHHHMGTGELKNGQKELNTQDEDYYKFLDPRQRELLDRVNRYTDQRIVIPGVNEAAVDHKTRKKTVNLGSDYNDDNEQISHRKRDINDIYFILVNMNEKDEAANFLNQSDVCLKEQIDSTCSKCIGRLILRTVAKLGPNKGSVFYQRVNDAYPQYL
jgi:hypothetical protein